MSHARLWGLVMTILDWLLDPTGLTAHGFCLSWEPGLVALHAGSDSIIGLAYFSIPVALISLVGRRRDLTFGWMIYLFVAFILACGMTHLLAVLTLWVPAYGVEGLIKLATAALSIATAVVLWPLIPKLVALPSPAQLEQLNAKLSATILEQEHTTALLRASEARGRTANVGLKRRGTEQTAELREANAQLTTALAQRLSALQALAISEEAFRTSFEAAVVGKVQVDPASARILRANAAFARMLGYKPRDLVGHIAWEFTWPEDRAADMAKYSRLLSGDISIYVGEKRYLRRDGEPLWGRMSGTIVRSRETGQPALMVAVIEDIDERYKAQVALQAAKRELEDVVDQRTLALQQRDLLLREVYHRVKNNLQIVDSLLVMQGRRLTDPHAKAMLLGLRGRIQALGLVHHQLMGSANLKTFNIAPFLEELSNNILDSGAADGISLSVQAVPLDVGLDFAIPLGLLVTELVTNSLKHGLPLKTGNLAVILEQDDDGEVVLVVSDDGEGRVDDQAASWPSKVGLGTTIIAGLVAQLRGTITVKHEKGTRTEVRIAAPMLS
jgi:PAS domain S-box-containing protein